MCSIGWNSLARLVSRLQSLLAILPRPRHVLELGCGDCPVPFEPDVITINLDIDGQALRRARRQSAASYLIQADIRQLPLMTQFDLILARHPDLDRHPGEWRLALDGAPELLTHRGLLVITTYSAHEVETLRDWLRRQPLIQFPLELERLSKPGLDGADRFILAFQLRTLFD